MYPLLSMAVGVLIVDYFLYGQFSVEKAVGALVILLGLAVKTLIDRHVAAS